MLFVVSQIKSLPQYSNATSASFNLNPFDILTYSSSKVSEEFIVFESLTEMLALASTINYENPRLIMLLP